MEISKQRVNDILIIKISGKLDASVTQQFETTLMSAVEEGEKKILLDCKDLDYINSAGLRVLLLAAKLLKNSGGKIMLSSLKDNINQVFEISGFSGLFPIYPTLDAAVKNN